MSTRPRTKLTPEVIERVLFYTKEGKTVADICTETGVSPSTVTRAKRILIKEHRLKQSGRGRKAEPKQSERGQTDFIGDTDAARQTDRRRDKLLLIDALTAACERNLRHAEENLRLVKIRLDELKEADDGSE